MKKKILWVTPDCFVDCDIPYVPQLLEFFNIHWLVLLPLNNCRYHDSDFTSIATKHKNLTVEIIKSTSREREIVKIAEYWRVIKAIKSNKPDVVYLNVNPHSPWQIPMFLALPKDKTIITAHQGRVHEGMGHYRYYNFIRDVVYQRIKNVNMFSKSQATYFKERYPNSNIYQFPLGLKYLGEPTNERPRIDDGVRLLLFGLIVKNKNFPILVDAVNNLYEKGINDIKVIIRGKGDAIDNLKAHFKYPEIIDADFRFLDNDELPNLFNGCHYFVLPYNEMSQSGAIKVAMRYNLPLITSDLEGFTDEMSIGNTGFVFKNNNVSDLENVLLKCYKIAKDREAYSNLRQKMNRYVFSNYSTEKLIQSYVEMFLQITKK